MVGGSCLSSDRGLFLHDKLGIASYTINDGEIAFCTQSPSASRALDYDRRLRVAFRIDGVRSGFNGARRQVEINDNQISNAGERAVWYTDPFGRNGRSNSFAGCVRQEIASINNAYRVGINDPVIGGERSYSGVEPWAPN